jgi:hypothetical protein
MLASLTTSNDIAEEKDSLGGGSRVRESGIYRFTVALAYLQLASSEAMGLHLVLKDEAGEFKQAMYLTSGKEKGKLNYYKDKDGNKHYLPGFNMANSLALLTTGREISALSTEEKVVNIYNFESKSEVPTKVQCITDIMGQEVYAAVMKRVVDKSAKDAAGVYQPTGETREENEIDKFFCAKDGFDKMTSAEIKAKQASGTTPEVLFFDQWAEKNNGKVIDKSTKGAGAGKPGAPGKPAGAGAAPAAGKPTTSLFGG